MYANIKFHTHRDAHGERGAHRPVVPIITVSIHPLSSINITRKIKDKD